MQGLAFLLKQNGHFVSGSDDGSVENSIVSLGIQYLTHIPENTDVVIRSSAIKDSHFLAKEASSKGLRIVNRVDAFVSEEFFKLNEQILVAGAHGKTTTSAMLAHALGQKSYVIGGIINGNIFPAAHEKTNFSVIETDESDGSFCQWNGKYRVITNCDPEHMDFFKTEENLISYYSEFIKKTGKEGICIINVDCPNLKKIIQENQFDCEIITYGQHKGDYLAKNLRYMEDGLVFDIKTEQKEFKDIFIPMLGQHNAMNATAVFAMLDQIGKEKTINDFPGTKKRLTKVCEKNGATWYSDYGHHPLEIACVLEGFEKHKKHKPTVVIEPHKYSRLQFTWQDWAKSLYGHEVFIMPIYSAGENPIEGINDENFTKFLYCSGINVTSITNLNEIRNHGKSVICFGAGKIDRDLLTFSKIWP